MILLREESPIARASIFMLQIYKFKQCVGYKITNPHELNEII